MFYPRFVVVYFRQPPSSYDRTWCDKYSGGLVLAQNIFLFLLVLYFGQYGTNFTHTVYDHVVDSEMKRLLTCGA